MKNNNEKILNNKIENFTIIKLTLIALIIGLSSGLMIGLFLILLKKAIDLNLKYYCLIFILPISGMFMTFLYSKFGGNAQKGNNLLIENINNSDEKINFIMAPLVFLGTILTHLFGGSVGREGSGVQIGGSFGSSLSYMFKCNKEEKKILVISGISAGFSSVFGTPLAGTVFALEVSNIGYLKYSAMLPAIAAAIVGDYVVRILKVKHTTFDMIKIDTISITSIFKIIIIAICFGLASKLFVFMTGVFKKYLNKYFKNKYLKIFVGGSLMVIATLIIGNRVYNNLSLSLLTGTFTKNYSNFAFIIKLLLTTLCLGAGYQGGEVTPLFVIGATLGSTLAGFIGLPLAVCSALGLVGVFSGATKTPLASFLMYLELFGSTNIIFALLVCIISVFVSGKKGIYSSQIWLNE